MNDLKGHSFFNFFIYYHLIQRVSMKESLLILILLFSVSVVSSYPVIPESYWGYARINGTIVPEGTNITVKVTTSNETVGSTLVGINGLYTMDVYFDDPDTTIDEGANEGDSLIWFINNMVTTVPSQGYDKANSTEHPVNNNFNVGISAGCLLKGDKAPCDGKVGDFELLSYIAQWDQNNVGDFDLLEAINNWAAIK